MNQFKKVTKYSVNKLQQPTDALVIKVHLNKNCPNQEITPFQYRSTTGILGLDLVPHHLCPISFSEEPPRSPFPVIVFVHGESFSWGSGNLYDGRVLASYAGAVVVTFNYRLGVFGEQLTRLILGLRSEEGGEYRVTTLAVD